ncbi:CDP-glycerol glycerophosphotransferase family protein [Butyrivibrio sp. INlla14]|uniref:CDP-glycerol glycerophosphotransferase family protein n=1 Tax=Butyrivibrio sp. INlla14 TaxID=1520808 RepID=UPI000876544C|nr:CDP-glycerol glycerophosphotransferase family protein [Butyrivibrio sp. INlla14]SCY74485.1 CDP-Glycerol:Poly(glycerophosphate) glycerophosphotransferase [Butyrivibrio sp. INlla14]
MERIELLSGSRLRTEKRNYYIILLARFMEQKLDWLPVSRNNICFITSTRRYYADNMRYVIEELKKQELASKKIYWITRHPEQSGKAIEDGVFVIRYRSLKHLWIQFFSKVVVCDDIMYPGLIKRKRQTYINVWHGGINYKGIGKNAIVFPSKFQRRMYSYSNPEPDYMVAGCEAFIDYIRKAFGFNHTYFLTSGLPRNDLFFGNYEKKVNDVKKMIGCEEKKIVCYMPTFRHDKKSLAKSMFDSNKVLKALENRFGGDWIFAYRLHYFDWENILNKKNEGVNLTEYDDISELLCAVDVLISDYSSCMWDFEVLEKLCISYIPDSEIFEQNDRGLTEQGHNMPYPMAKSTEELVNIIDSIKMDEYIDSIRKHKLKVNSYEQGTASKIVAELIIRQG